MSCSTRAFFSNCSISRSRPLSPQTHPLRLCGYARFTIEPVLRKSSFLFIRDLLPPEVLAPDILPLHSRQLRLELFVQKRSV
jgi:hypothetical protein